MASNKSATQTASSGSTTMAELMAKHTSSITNVSKGQMVKGIVTKLTPSEILLDISGKTEAVVMEKERHLLKAMLQSLKIGDTVDAQVLNPESDTGNTVVSLRRFMDGRVWDRLAAVQKNSEKITVNIKGSTKGGYLITTSDGLDGFLPNSHVAPNQNMTDMVGKQLSVMIAELNPQTRKLIVSQKQVFGQADFDGLVKQMKRGEKVEVLVNHITSFGMFVSVPVKSEKEEMFLDGFIHISEIAWEKVTNIADLFEVGQATEAVVLGVDNPNKRVELSIKKLTRDPYEAVLKKYTVDQKITGIIAKIAEQGIVVDVSEDGVEGFIRKEKIPPTVTYTVGQEVKLTVTDIDNKKHRVYLAPVLLDKPLMYR